jgi:hypothetical protein
MFQVRLHTVTYAGIRRGRKCFLSMLRNSVRIRTYGLYDKHTLAGAAEPWGQWGPVPPHFLKVKKVPFFLGLNAPFKERKKYFLNKRPLFLERKCRFRSSKDSVKAISDVDSIF